MTSITRKTDLLRTKLHKQHQQSYTNNIIICKYHECIYRNKDKLTNRKKKKKMKKVQIWSIFWSIFSRIWTEYVKNRPENTYLDTFYSVN